MIVHTILGQLQLVFLFRQHLEMLLVFDHH